MNVIVSSEMKTDKMQKHKTFFFFVVVFFFASLFVCNVRGYISVLNTRRCPRYPSQLFKARVC